MMSQRRFNADTPLGRESRIRVEQLRRTNPDARALFELVRERQLDEHPPRDVRGHTPAQRANATQMANKAVAMRFLDWPPAPEPPDAER